MALALLDGVRSPIGRFQGALSQLDGVELAGITIRALLERNDLTPDEVLLGNVIQAGNGQNPARQAAVRGGVPMSVPALTLNDVCLSGLSAVRFAEALLAGSTGRTILFGGFDSATCAPHAVRMRMVGRLGPAALEDLLIHDGLRCAFDETLMGELSDHENARLGISREDQDELAWTSHQRAAAAAASALLTHEITAVHGLERDEGVRSDVSLEQLAGLRPAFTETGTITAGNASQLSDAASVGLLTDEATARANGRELLGRVLGVEVVAGPDPSLHLKPAGASARLLRRFGLVPSDVDVWEMNEAFAGVVLASARELGLDPQRVNRNGGAIAVGHPFAATGPRLLIALAYEMRRCDLELGVATMCGGGGQGIAVLVQHPDAAALPIRT